MLTKQWHKSSYSGHEGACVEARLDVTSVEVRDTKDKSGPTLDVGFADWHRLIADLRTDRM